MYFGFIITLYCFSIIVSECFPFSHISKSFTWILPCFIRDRPSAADCMTHPWLWFHCPGSDSIPVTPRTPRERSFGGKWSAPPEDPEDKENILDSPHTKRFRFEEDMSATGDGDHLCWSEREMHMHWIALSHFWSFLVASTQHQQTCFCPNAVFTILCLTKDDLFTKGPNLV